MRGKSFSESPLLLTLIPMIELVSLSCSSDASSNCSSLILCSFGLVAVVVAVEVVEACRKELSFKLLSSAELALEEPLEPRGETGFGPK